MRRPLFMLAGILALLSVAGCGSGIDIDASKPPGADAFADAPANQPFMTGLILHNALPVMTTDEMADARGAGVAVFHPDDPTSAVFFGATAGAEWSVRALAVEPRTDGLRLWVGTLFDGAWLIDLDRGRAETHYTMQNSGVPLSASPNGDDTLRAPLPAGIRLPPGALPNIMVNTELFRTLGFDGRDWKLKTYASHDLPHSMLPAPVKNPVTLLTGLPDNTVNDILIDGATVWLATGTPLDKGLAGGVVFIHPGCGPDRAGDPECFGNRRPDAVFNPAGRFNWQRSNVAIALTRQGNEIWSGWAEIRGARNWGGVSGNLLSFRGDGSDPATWHDHTQPVTLTPDYRGYAMHTSVPAIAPITLHRRGRDQACVIAGTRSINNTEPGLGFPGRRAEGGNGIRVICDHIAVAAIAKEFVNQRPRPDSISSNAVFDLFAGRVDENGELWAIVAADAGLSIFEVGSRIDEWRYPRPAGSPVTRVGSRWLDGVDRGDEVLHGFTLGSESFPACLPDMRVQALQVSGGLSELSDTVIRAGTMAGLAEYRGPFLREALMDCRNWSWYRFRRGAGGISVDRMPAGAEAPAPDWLPVSAITETPDGRLAVGLAAVQADYSREGAAMRSMMNEAEAQFPARPVTSIRTHYSLDYEDSQEFAQLPDSSAINLYTPAFHQKPCFIDQPDCLAGDTALNWRHFDRLYDSLVGRDLAFILCPATFPVDLYVDFIKDGPCAPPRPLAAECAPSRANWDFRRWENLVFAVTDHLYRRYGREKAGSLALEVWNEEAISWNWPWPDSFPEDYAVLISHVQAGVRACDEYWDYNFPATKGRRLMLAGPAWHGDPLPPDRRLSRTLDAMKQRKVEIDFLTAHLYPFRRIDYTDWYKKFVELSRGSGYDLPVEITEHNLVMMQAHDGAPTLGAGEVPALSFVASADGLYRQPRPPRMMYYTDIFNGMLGIRGNYTSLWQGLGTRVAAPRPAWNAAVLLAQAGELPVRVKARGPARAMARLEPHTGRRLVLVWQAGVKAPWKQTVDYLNRKLYDIPFDLTGLPGKTRAREWRIDGDHANVLTAIWREGSPDQPDRDQLGRLLAGSRLSPLTGDERALPAELIDKIHTRLKLPENGIWAVELAPAPALGAARTIAGPRMELLPAGGLRVSWLADGGRVSREYDGKLRQWGPARQEWQPSPKRCQAAFNFNGERHKLSPAPDGAGGWTLLDGDSAATVAVALPDAAAEPACFIDPRLRLHLAYETSSGAIAYQVFNPVATGGGPLSWLGAPARPVSAFEPWPARKPREPVVAADASGVHVVWVEKDGVDFGRPEAVIYQFLR